MKITEQSKEGVIYQLEMTFEEIGTVFVNICYSGDTDDAGNEILEFCWANAEDEDNGHLSEVELDEANDILECGREEDIVLFLQNVYAESGIRFDVGEWKHNPLSILYNQR